MLKIEGDDDQSTTGHWRARLKGTYYSIFEEVAEE
jgi:hypothetical protein